LVVIGWLLPWASAGHGDVSGTSDALQWWFQYLVLGAGVLAIAAGALSGRQPVPWLVAAAAVVATGVSLIFPGAVYVGSRAAAGFADAAANVGPSVTHEAGTYVLSLGIIAVVVGSGPAGTRRRSIWMITAGVGGLIGLLLVIGLI
jgi:hypothetical protein